MGRKRKDRNTDSEIREKIQKLEDKLNKKTCRRLRILSSSSDEDETNDSPTTNAGTSSTSASSPQPPQPPPPPPPPPATEPPAEIDLDEETLLILGDAPKEDNTLGPNIHKDVALRWQEILVKGLSKDSKEKLLKEYNIPANCGFLVPPLINPEVKAALPESLVKRDASLSDKQKQIGIGLAALAQATQMLISKDEHTKILKAVSDACRMLCDAHFLQTKIRRDFVISATNSSMKETLQDAQRDKYLFGDCMGDKLKSAKMIQKSGSDLKPTVKNPKFNKNNFIKNKNTLNIRALHRKAGYRPAAGTARTAPPATRTVPERAPPAAPRTRARSPPPRRSARQSRRQY